MALSNIFREPRREITESMVGMTVFVIVAGVALIIAWHLADSIVAQDPGAPFPLIVFFMLIIEAIVSVLAVELVFVTHGIGEAICNALARRGVEFRPKRR